MATETDIYEIDMDGALKAIGQLQSALKGTEKNTKEAASSLSELNDFLEEGLAKNLLGSYAKFTAIIEVLKKVGEFVVEGTKAFLEEEQMLVRLDVALQNTGNASEGLRAAFVEQQKALEETTGASAEATGAMQTMLLSMGVAPDMIERVVAAAYNLAAATGTDATAAARTLARANAEGKDELKKFGIVATETMDDLSGFASALEQVENRFGGVHEKMPPMLKDVHALGAAWDDFGKGVGSAAVKISDLTGATGIATTILKGWTELLTHSKMEEYYKQDELNDRMQETVAQWKAQREEARILQDLLINGGKELNTAGGRGVVEQRLRTQIEAVQKLSEEMHKMSPKGDDLEVSVQGDVKEAGAYDLADEMAKDEEKRAVAREKAKEAYKKWRDEQDLIASTSNANLEKMDDEVRAKQKKGIEDTASIWVTINEQEYARNEQFTKDQLEILKSEEAERIRIADKAAAEQKAIWESLKQAFKGYATTVVTAGADMVFNALQQNAAYTAAYKNSWIERREVQLQEMGLQVDRAAIEDEYAANQIAAVEKALAGTLAGIGKDASVKAVMEGAEALASLASGDVPSATAHGIAAAAFGGVALTAGIATAALSASRGMTEEEKSQVESMDKRKQERTARAASAGASASVAGGAGTTQNVYFFGISGMSDVEQASELERLKRRIDQLRTGA